MMKFLSVVLCVAAVPAVAADSQGRFAVDGVGRLRCSDFVESYAAKDARAFSFAGWTDGFISAMNVLRPDTFDLTSFQPIDLTMAKMNNHCQQNPDEPYVNAVGKLVASYAPSRIREQGETTRFERGGKTVVIYDEVVARIADRISKAGFQTDGLSTVEILNQHLLTYQKQEGLPETGLPDIATLNHFFP